MTELHLDGVLAALNRHHQRATYSAVAALVGESPRMLMHGRPREQASSWIVSKATGVPSGYSDAEVHPELKANETILRTREELAAWLEARQTEN
jgi:hypothetical protein